jgi:hypothetical protein
MAAPVICPQCGRVLKTPEEQADPNRLCSRCKQLAAASVPDPAKQDFPALPSLVLNLRPLGQKTEPGRPVAPSAPAAPAPRPVTAPPPGAPALPPKKAPLPDSTIRRPLLDTTPTAEAVRPPPPPPTPRVVTTPPAKPTVQATVLPPPVAPTAGPRAADEAEKKGGGLRLKKDASRDHLVGPWIAHLVKKSLFSRKEHDAGPFTFDELVCLVISGELEPETPIRRQHEQEWQPAQSLAELFTPANLAARERRKSGK